MMLKIASATSAKVTPRSRGRSTALRRGRLISGGSIRASSILVERGSGGRDVGHTRVLRARHQQGNHAVESPLIGILDDHASIGHVGGSRSYGLCRDVSPVDGKREGVRGHTSAACGGGDPGKGFATTRRLGRA